MNENVVDVLIYLYENYMDGDPENTSDQQVIYDELVQAGFPEQEINKAFDWMDGLAARQHVENCQVQTEYALRIYTDEECRLLNLECRSLLLFLEQNSIIDQKSRELVIDRALALDTPQIGVEELKWIILMVLMSQPGKESAFAQMEDLVYNDIPVYLH